MRILRVTAVLALFAATALAQDQNQSADLLSTAKSHGSLNMFVSAVQSSGMAKMLKDEGPFTVFAPSDRAFSGLAKDDRETLFTNHAAMHMLLGRYIVRGTVGGDSRDLSSARTLLGVKLHLDDRNGTRYVNGATLTSAEISCSNGTIHILDRFDPGLVHEAVEMARRR